MSKEKIYIFDTTLRDGAQTQGVDFSLNEKEKICLLYTSDAADDMQCVDLGGRRIIKKKK